MTGSARYGNPAGATDDVQVVRALYDAFSRRDLAAMNELVADDVVLHLQGTRSRSGQAGPYRGHDGVRQYFEDVDAVWDDLQLHADDIRAVAGSVVVFGHVTGRTDGADVRRRVVWTWRLRGRKAVSVRADDLGDG